MHTKVSHPKNVLVSMLVSKNKRSASKECKVYKKIQTVSFGKLII